MRTSLWILLHFFLLQSNQMTGQNLDSIGEMYYQQFTEAFQNEDYEIGQMTIKPDSTKCNFEIDIIPQKKGVYFIEQVYTYEDGWGYENNSILNVIKVAEKGTARTFLGREPSPFISYTCSVGDTIVVPIYWNPHVTSNSFSKSTIKNRIIWGKLELEDSKWEVGQNLDQWRITNQVEEFRVLDVFSSNAVFRDLKQSRVTHALGMEAIKPGKLTLQVGNKELPVTIYPQDESIRKYVTLVRGYSWEDRVGSDGLPIDYSKGDGRILMRVGDKISVVFLTYVEEVKNPRAIERNIVVSKR